MREGVRRLSAPLAIAATVAIFYGQLTFQRLVVGDYDAFVYFYPLREYAARVLSGAGFPLWNPFLFMGAPFFANVQTAVLYPFNVLFMLLPTPYAFSASVVGHVLLAAIGMYLFGRSTLGVSRLPSMLGAITFSLSGFISFQVSHINQLSVSAWLPALLVVFDLAVRRRSLPAAVAAGFIGTMQLLAGHTQEWYFSTATLGLFALWRVVFPVESIGMAETGGAGKTGFGSSPAPTEIVTPLRRVLPLLLLIAAGAVEIGVAAIQWMPTLELSSYSIRGGGLAYGEAISFSLPPTVALYTLLPSYPSDLFSEYVGYVGVIPLTLAAIAVAMWRSRPGALAMAALAAFGLVMALGGYNPLAPLLFKWVPGLSLFRVPARWLLVYTFAVSGLAAIGAQQLMDGRLSRLSKESGRAISGLTAFAVAAGTFGFALVALALMAFLARPVPQRSLVLIWAGLATATLLVWLLGFLIPRIKLVALLVLILASGAELWEAGASAVYQHPVPAAAYAPSRDSTSYIRGKLSSDGAPERVLSIATDDYEVKETPDYQKDFSWLSPESLRQFLVDVKLSETLAPNTPMEYGIQSPDGYDGGILPLKRYADLKEQILPPAGSAPDSLLRNNLQYVPPERVLDLLGVKYVLAGKIRDAKVDNVYYDRGISVDLNDGESTLLRRMPEIRATSIGILSSTSGARSLPDGTVAGTIVVTDDTGKSYDLPLRLGSDTAETRIDDNKLGLPAHKRPREVAGWPSERGDTDYFTKIKLPAQIRISEITMKGGLQSATLRVRAITLIDDVAAQTAPLVLSDRFDRELFFDMKVYSYRDAMPRAFVVYNSAVRDDELALGQLSQGTVSVKDAAWLAPSPSARSFYRTSGPSYDPRDARVTSYAAEKIAIDATARDDGYLVVSDSYFPGWIAKVDGKDVPVERVDFAFRGVYLQKGHHTVVFEYAPSTFQVGRMVSAISVLLLGAALSAFPLRGRLRGRVL